MTQLPNILLVVWDACRLDAAREHAPTLSSLAEDNLWFENAIAPAGTSLPSHVSMVTGRYPHEHGIFRQTHTVDSMPLLSELEKCGYERYGVSANGFASARYGFDAGFDNFYNTQGLTVYPDGLDLHRYARRVAEETGDTFSVKDVDEIDLLRVVLGHSHRLKSLANVLGASLSELVGRFPALQRIPHRRFNRFNEFCYSPDQNTRLIRRIFREEGGSDNPFFLFTNYMDAHHPYAPASQYQREYCGRTFGYRELSRLADLTHPLNYLSRMHEEGPLDDSTLEVIRGLYAGEVRTADEHLGRLLDELDEQGLRENTLVVVTADHGENLGETNRMGENRMGHICSASDNHLRVPLVVAHPSIEARTVEEYVSLKDLCTLFTDGLVPFIESDGRDLDGLKPSNRIVSSQVPAKSNTVLEEKYPQVREILNRHLSVSYNDGWKVVLSSAGTSHVWYQGEARDVDEAPAAVVTACRDNLEELASMDSEERDLSAAERSHLEALGYL